jgi:hypothetical protein
VTFRRLLLATTLVVLAGACGDDSSDGDDGSGSGSGSGSEVSAGEQAYVDALVEDMTDPEDAPMPEESARCLATQMVAVADPDVLDAEGITPDDWAEAESFDDLGLDTSDEVVDEIAVAVDDCLGDELAPFVADAFEVEGDAGSCLADAALENDELDRLFAAAVVRGGDGEGGAELAVAIVEDAPASCLEEVLIAQGLSSGDIDPAQADCIRDGLDDEVARRVLLSAVAGDEPVEDDFALLEGVILGCVGG